MDVHWRTTTVCILNEYGRRVKRKRIDGPWRKVLRFIGRIDEDFQIAFEASCGYGFLYDALCEMATRVVVAHPGHLRLIFRAKNKNDRVDAEKLAKLLYLDEVPPAYVPSGQVRQWRELIEYRQTVVGRVVGCKNRLRALLRSRGIVAPKGLWTRAGRRWLADVELTGHAGLRRELLLDELNLLRHQLRRVTKELDAMGRKSPAVVVLQTIPGVGPRTAEAMAAYIADARRFSNNRAIGAYLGLVPRQDSSAGVQRLGHITKQGPSTARKLLVEASWQVIRRCPRTLERFERLCQGRKERRKTALVAIARHLACCMVSMLQTGEAWRAAA